MRRTDEERERARRGTMDGDLADSNEQEMEKIGFRRGESTAREERRRASVPRRRAEQREKARPAAIIKGDERIKGKGEEKTKKAEVTTEVEKQPSLPDRAERERSLGEREAVRLPKKETHIQREETEEMPKEARREPPRQSEPPTRKERERGMGAVLALMGAILLLALAILGGTWAYVTEEESRAETDSEEVPSTEGQKVIFVRQDPEEGGALSTPELYAACADTVVSILTQQEGKTGVGSGFLITADGYVGTAYHVLEGASSQTVILSDGSRYEATFVAGDALTDLALLKIDGKGLPTVTVGSSAELVVGERVCAIGTPAALDYAGSISTGEVSYLDRTVRIREEISGAMQKKMKLIQTTAPVNPGNSGCPLFDAYGRLVGVITMKLGSDFAGIGFAIPSDGAMPILRAMMAGQTPEESLLTAIATTAPKLGVMGEAANVGGIYGVRIRGFAEESDAAQVLREGDLITVIDGSPVCSLSDVERALEEREPGDRISVTVLRGAQSLTFEVALKR